MDSMEKLRGLGVVYLGQLVFRKADGTVIAKMPWYDRSMWPDLWSILPWGHGELLTVELERVAPDPAPPSEISRNVFLRVSSDQTDPKVIMVDEPCDSGDVLYSVRTRDYLLIGEAHLVVQDLGRNVWLLIVRRRWRRMASWPRILLQRPWRPRPCRMFLAGDALVRVLRACEEVRA